MLPLSPCICQCMRRFFVKRPTFLAVTSNLRVEQNLVHLGRLLYFSQKVVGVTLSCYPVLECYNMFPGVKLSIRSIVSFYFERDVSFDSHDIPDNTMFFNCCFGSSMDTIAMNSLMPIMTIVKSYDYTFRFIGYVTIQTRRSYLTAFRFAQ